MQGHDRGTVNRVASPLLIVTDRHQASRPLPAVIEEALAAGARWIWLRDRDLAMRDRALLAAQLATLTKRAGAMLSVGADIALAAEVGADGVHLSNAALVAEARRRLAAGALIGVSAHALDDVRRAAEAGADYACLSPIFATPSKPGYGPALGPAALEQAARSKIAVVALGGITAERVADCTKAGAVGVAVMGEVMRAASPGLVVEGLLHALEAGRKPDRSAP
jgi:thiamine-phosphate pyrophosphorylase